VSTEPPGVVITVHGPLGGESDELLSEVVRAALFTVKRAARIHLDLAPVWPVPARMPQVIRRLVRAGARVTEPAGRVGSPLDPRLPAPRTAP
jgi:hypothetical protein